MKERSKGFFCEEIGFNADIERHRKEEAYMREKIAELEGKDDYFSVHALRVYRRLLGILLQSKADLTSKIGKKNTR